MLNVLKAILIWSIYLRSATNDWSVCGTMHTWELNNNNETAPNHPNICKTIDGPDTANKETTINLYTTTQVGLSYDVSKGPVIPFEEISADSCKEFFDLLEYCPEKSTINTEQLFIPQDDNQVETSDNILSPDDILISIQNQSAILQQEATEIIKNMGEWTKKWYENKFLETEHLSNNFISQCDTDFLLNTMNYSYLDRNIQALFFDFVYNELVDQTSLVFSESKFSTFLSMTNWTVYSTLAIYFDMSYELLNIIEYLTVQKYYKEVDELIVLERVRLTLGKAQHYLFYYLRCLNVLLRNFSGDNTVSMDSRDKIILLINKIIVSVSPIKKCDIARAKEKSVDVNSCERTHVNYLYIFIYILDADARSKIMNSRNNILGGYCLLDSLKVVSLHLLHNYLLLNTYLSFQSYKKENIDDFIKSIKDPILCANCLMEDCVSILCGTNKFSSLNDCTYLLNSSLFK